MPSFVWRFCTLSDGASLVESIVPSCGKFLLIQNPQGCKLEVRRGFRAAFDD
ncbi:MAG: hypothetical protein FWD57_11275 [Polyangiaceae bacterium]|nr:hypothetical protein [Polyangiaceae bacterium]